jgi:hypothetical protein
MPHDVGALHRKGQEPFRPPCIDERGLVDFVRFESAYDGPQGDSNRTLQSLEKQGRCLRI